jgi:predicted nucleic acid-binding Zn ribbon protein
MPMYDYFCQQCKDRDLNKEDPKSGTYEVEQSIKDDHLKECPHCRTLSLESGPPKKLISLSGFVLKSGGVGWASNKYSK